MDCEKLLLKVAGMFSPVDKKFLSFDAKDVIKGPVDRAVVGFDTFFPIKWLVEDFNFTEEEARQFIDLVHKVHADKKEA